jgi:hypothetical protein
MDKRVERVADYVEALLPTPRLPVAVHMEAQKAMAADLKDAACIIREILYCHEHVMLESGAKRNVESAREWLQRTGL